VSTAFVLYNEGRVHGEAETFNGFSQKDNCNSGARNKHSDDAVLESVDQSGYKVTININNNNNK
jgi:hypothetical protein